MKLKKIFPISCWMIALVAASGVARGQDWVIERASTPPVIDGSGDDAVWATATAHGFDEFYMVDNAGGELDGAGDLSVFWKGLWDDTNLYLFAEVTDDEIVNDDSCNWEDDSIEFYIDAQNLAVAEYRPDQNPGVPAYQFTAIAGANIDESCGSLRIPDGSTSVFTWGINSYDAPDPFNTDDDITQYPQGADTSVSVVKDAQHYTLEVAFPWEALEETPANIRARGQMGFGVAVNDDDDFGGRDNQAMWATTRADLWSRSDAFPTVALVEPGEGPPPVYVGGQGTIGTRTEDSGQENPVYGPPGDPTPGLAQEWFAVANPGSKAGVDTIFEDNDPIVEPFNAGHGATWWTGSQAPLGDLVQYPAEVQPPLNGTGNDNYTVRATGELLIPESGTYRFTDGVDDYTYWAIDLDKSGVAGDDPIEVLIDDNAWTNVLRDGNDGQGLAEVEIDVEPGGEWLAVEFNMAEGTGGDAGVIYWDYDLTAPEGQRLGGAAGFPEISSDILDEGDAETMYIPDTHLRSVVRELLSADLVASITTTRPIEFDVNGDTDMADQLVVENPDPNVYTTILDIDGATFQIAAIGALADGDTFDIIEADQILGTPIITSLNPAQTWSFVASTGQIRLGGILLGDYNGNSLLDAEDLDLQAIQMNSPSPDLAYDLTGDGKVDYADRQFWVEDASVKNSWIGDADLNGEFSSGDMVQVFVRGLYETGNPAGWEDGDWNGDTKFGSGDMVAAFVGGGYEKGLKPGGPKAAVSAVPEPSSVLLALLGVLSLVGLARRR